MNLFDKIDHSLFTPFICGILLGIYIGFLIWHG